MESSRIEQFGKELAEAYKEVATIKWQQDFVCSGCGFSEYFEGKFPYSRRCAKCKKDYSPTAGTIFHGVRFPLHVALYIIKRVAATKDRMTSEALTEELSTKFKLELRQKTVWSFLMKVYNAMIFPIPEFTGYVTLIRLKHGNKAILILEGRRVGKKTISCIVTDKEDSEHYENIKNSYVDVFMYDAVVNRKLETRLAKRERNTYVSLISIDDSKQRDLSTSEVALDVYNSIAGKSPQHYQAYLNFYCYHVNKWTYDQLMDILVPKA